MKTAVNIC